MNVPATPQTGYRGFRARQDDQTAIIDPPIDDAELLIKDNRSRAAGFKGSSESELWSDLSMQARHQMIQDARRYTSAYRTVSDRTGNDQTATDDVSASSSSVAQPIVMAGHQPTLFHPGVWFKNFALQHIGQDSGSHAVNLVIDNDVASSRSIRVPIRDSLGRVRVQAIGYDSGGAGIPYEQAKIRDIRQFDAFDKEVRQAIAPMVANPLISELWPHAREALRRCEIAGCALAQARHALEGELGWNTLEIPLGVAVRGLPFARFVMQWTDDFERFHQVYNDSAEHYRAWHGIRSTAHPVPNLAIDGDYYELPLWVYGNDSPTRRAIWVRRSAGQIELTDRSGDRPSVWLPSDDRDRAAMVLADAASPEFKLRPRALVTTMFARLLLSDLFLHGIGGGKYDQLADRIMAKFFGIQPPSIQVVSATLRLPGQMVDDHRGDEIRSLKRKIRDTRYQGERWASSEQGEVASDSSRGHLSQDFDDAASRKRELLAKMPEPGKRAEWHRQILSVNERLSSMMEPQRAAMRSELARLHQESAEEQILASREWSFCLFSLEHLQSAYRSMVTGRGQKR